MDTAYRAVGCGPNRCYQPDPPTDPINSPAHYKVGPIEAIDVIEAFQLNYRTGNVAKYLLRHQYKGEPLKDLKKAAWYLSREIARLEKEQSK